MGKTPWDLPGNEYHDTAKQASDAAYKRSTRKTVPILAPFSRLQILHQRQPGEKEKKWRIT